jgi:hypothetical protein
MNLFNPIQATFQAGQLSPSFLGRRDTKQYYSGAKLIKNMVVTPSGAVTRRPPTKHLDWEASGLNSTYSLFAFQSGPDKSYLIQVIPDTGSTSIVIWKRSSGTTTQVHSFTTGSSWDLFSGWNTASTAQSRDVMYFTFAPSIGSQKISKLTRLSDTSWTLTEVDLEDGPYELINLDEDVKLQANAKNATTISAEDEAGVAVSYFTTADIGKVVRIRHNLTPSGDTAINWGYAVINSLSGASPAVTVNVTTLSKFGGASGGTTVNRTKNFKMGIYGDLGPYPQEISFHQNRLFIADNNRILGSIANDFENHAPTQADNEDNHLQTPDSAIDVKMLDLRAARINWLSSSQVLHIGTNDGRYIIKSPDGTLQPANLSFIKQSNVGTSSVAPVVVDNTIYSRFDNQALLSTDFNFRRDRYEDKNLNIYSDTILTPKVQRLAYTSYPFNIIWALLEDGTMAALTYDTEQEILAWSIHEIKDCKILDIVSLKAEDEIEVLYLKVQNNNDPLPAGVSLQEMDLSNWDYLKTDTAVTNPLLDAHVLFTSTTSLTGLQHLEANNIMAVQNGVNYPQTGTVSGSGTFTLADTITGEFEVGLPIEIELTTFPIDVPASNTTQIGKVKGIKDLQCQMLNTLSLSAKLSTSANTEDFKFRKSTDPVNTVPPIFTGQKEIAISNNSDEDITVTFTQKEQAPCTILALSYEVNIER